jgi:protein-tyrosine phosphatase
MEEKLCSSKKKNRVLFICMANICRSPMAQVLFQDYLKKFRADWADWQVESAGTWALDGKPASKNSQIVMAQRGLDIRSHSSRTVTAEIISNADIILTMEATQKEALQEEFAFAKERIFLLTEMIGECTDLADPYGGPIKDYETTAQQLEEIIHKGMDRIIFLVEQREQK